MRTYSIEINGVTPLLMHADDVEWADEMDSWKERNAKAGDRKEKSKAGDDRTPAHRWIGYLYRDEATGVVALPTDMIMRCIMEGATSVLVPGSKYGKTFKAQSQSGIIPRGVGWPLLIPQPNGKAKADFQTLKYEPIKELMTVRDFNVHKARAQELGFSLFVKRAKVGATKHVRVRPRFESWAARGELTVKDDLITDDVLSDFFKMAGNYKGLGDWRPGAPKAPGSFGTFEATVKQIG